MRERKMSPTQRKMQAWCRQARAKPIPEQVLKAMANYRARRAAGVNVDRAMRQALGGGGMAPRGDGLFLTVDE